MPAPLVEYVTGIPVVDFSELSLENEKSPDFNNEAVRSVAKQVYEAFTTTGFLYLKNHGITQEKVDSLIEISQNFFKLSTEVKSGYRRCEGDRRGWSPVSAERNKDPKLPGDLKEMLEYPLVFDDESISKFWPDPFVPELKPAVKSMYSQCTELGQRLLATIGIGLGLESNAFAPAFQHCGKAGGQGGLRIIHYPPVEGEIKDKVDHQQQTRLGAHTDLGGVSFLFQDDAGGLQAQNLQGKYVDVTPTKGVVLAIVPDLLQRWTSDRLKATLHRVQVPKADPKRLHSPRYSIIFFHDPDREAVVKCLDGSNKYPPIKAGEYIDGVLEEIFSPEY